MFFSYNNHESGDKGFGIGDFVVWIPFSYFIETIRSYNEILENTIRSGKT
jgi:hypothetical protein